MHSIAQRRSVGIKGDVVTGSLIGVDILFLRSTSLSALSYPLTVGDMSGLHLVVARLLLAVSLLPRARPLSPNGTHKDQSLPPLSSK